MTCGFLPNLQTDLWKVKQRYWLHLQHAHTCRQIMSDLGCSDKVNDFVQEGTG